jgi:thymidylate synthase (FAD)
MAHDIESPQPETAEHLDRPHVEALDRVLGHPFKVLDDGFVRVVDYMGSDESIVQAARVSYGKGTKKIHEDRGLIRYLMRHRHTTPFEMCEIKLHIRIPMDAWRQFIRHRTANVNEYSTRYSVAIDAAQMTPDNEWRMQSAGNRQGSAGFVDEKRGRDFTKQEADLHTLSRRVYNERIEAGVAREQARKDLPLSTYTEAYWKCDLHNLFHFLSLRMDEHAQLEIRQYAQTMGDEIVSKWCPIAWEAFLDYRMGAMGFSRIETEIIQHINAGDAKGASAIAEKHGWLEPGKAGLKRNRERDELESKLIRLNLSIPWR